MIAIDVAVTVMFLTMVIGCCQMAPPRDRQDAMIRAVMAFSMAWAIARMWDAI